MKDSMTFKVTFGGNTFAPEKKMRSDVSKRLLEQSREKIRKEYNKLVQDGRLPDGQFDSFYAGYGLCLLEHC